LEAKLDCWAITTIQDGLQRSLGRNLLMVLRRVLHEYGSCLQLTGESAWTRVNVKDITWSVYVNSWLTAVCRLSVQSVLYEIRADRTDQHNAHVRHDSFC